MKAPHSIQLKTYQSLIGFSFVLIFLLKYFEIKWRLFDVFLMCTALRFALILSTIRSACSEILWVWFESLLLLHPLLDESVCCSQKTVVKRIFCRLNISNANIGCSSVKWLISCLISRYDDKTGLLSGLIDWMVTKWPLGESFIFGMKCMSNWNNEKFNCC